MSSIDCRFATVRRAMPAARKLFPSYGSAVAQALCHTLERDGMVRNFISGYAREFDRKAVAATAAQERELTITIGREALLAMIIEVREQMPRFFGQRRGAELAEPQAAATDAFFDELFSTLARVERWPAEDMAEFLRDLDLYVRMSPRRAAPSGKAAAVKSEAARTERFPFPDRCALLLDPSMMEKARRAADRFHGELIRAAGKILARTLGIREAR
jgi:hypothetical protein